MKVNKINPTITVDVPLNVYWGETVQADISINDDTAGNITVILNGATIANGTGSIKLNDLKLGLNQLTVNYTGDANYNPISQDYDIKVSKFATVIIISSKLSITASDTAAGEKGPFISGVLRDENGVVLTNQIVSVRINGKTINLHTDARGSFAVQLSLANAKAYDVVFSYAGSDKYAPAGKTVKVNVAKKKTKIKAKSMKFKKSKVKKLKVRLTSIKNPVDGKKYLKKAKRLTLKIKGKTYKAKTNRKGYATFKIKMSKRGKYRGVIRFKGDNTYAKSSKKIKITIR